MLFGVHISDVCTGMYLLDTEEAKNYELREPGFMVEIELAACSASNDSVTEVPITYRPRVGQGKLTAWDGFSILTAAFTLARRYNPILLYSGLSPNHNPRRHNLRLGCFAGVDNRRMEFGMEPRGRDCWRLRRLKRSL